MKRLGRKSDDPGISVLSVLAFFETPEDPPTVDFFGEAPTTDEPSPEDPAAA